jgi:Mor family transcriptional regulator
VPRPKSPAIASRDGELYARWNAGERNLAALAKDYGITPQRVGQVIAGKDSQIYAAWRTGKYTLADLAEVYELTSEDVTRIVTVRHPEQEDEKTGRAVLRSRIELLTIAIQEVIENPGWKITATGHLAEDPDGNPLVDTAAKIEAIKVQLNAYKNLAVLNGDEKPQRTNVTHEMAEQQKNTFIAAVAARREAELREREAERRELEALRRRAAVIPGEVMAELPPGS